MKTPIDNTTFGAGATVALLNGGGPINMIDLWTITLSGGGVVRWHGGPTELGSVTMNGNTWAAGPVLNRTKITTKIGPEVATMEVDVYANSNDLINGAAILPYLRGNGFDGATIKLETGYFPAWTLPLVLTGTTISFAGRVTSIKDLSKAGATLTVSSWMVLLNVKANPNIYQAPCLNSLYDSNCTMVKSAHTHAGAVVGSSGTGNLWNTNLTFPDDQFTQGQIIFTSGLNSGLERTVKKYLNAGGSVQIAYGLPNPPAAGDTFNIIDGCDLTMSRCKNFFNNLIHFRGQPFIPPPETLV